MSISCQVVPGLVSARKFDFSGGSPNFQITGGRVLCPSLFNHIIRETVRVAADVSHCIFNAVMSTVRFADSALSAGGYQLEGAL